MAEARPAREIPVFELSGAPAERGESFGEHARPLIAETADRWYADAAYRFGNRVDEYLDHLVVDSGFRATAAKLTPDLVAEVDGTALASNCDPRVVWALNLMDEDWWMGTRFAGSEGSEHCSGFGVAAARDQVAMVGQNMDLPGWLDGLQVMLDIRPSSGPAVLAPSYPGMCATNALSELGVGVCVNSLMSLPTSDHGVPVSFVIRTLAGQPDLEAAVRALQTLPHATGQNYIVGSPTGLVDLECGAGAVARLEVGARVAHTNHPLAEADGSPSSGAAWVSNSEHRMAHLTQRLAELDRVTVDAAGRFLAEAPLCRGGGEGAGFTFYSVIMELGPVPKLYLSPGPPNLHAYQVFEHTDPAAPKVG